MVIVENSVTRRQCSGQLVLAGRSARKRPELGYNARPFPQLNGVGHRVIERRAAKTSSATSLR
ncbi:hypothetical protein [Micromonospora sp. CB01531]|uniref:hypothetical protein n=1 Tax=Micromonospora sp. CB01531 TaxID=1718947 RepID=UPI001160ED45|nr:hypothetical protein [Micromonospora sp. CB01531]